MSFLPGVASSYIIYSFHSVEICPFVCHLFAHSLTLLICFAVGSSFILINELLWICSSAFCMSVTILFPLSCNLIIRSESLLNNMHFLQSLRAVLSNLVKLSFTFLLLVLENMSCSNAFKNVSNSGTLHFGGFQLDFLRGGWLTLPLVLPSFNAFLPFEKKHDSSYYYETCQNPSVTATNLASVQMMVLYYINLKAQMEDHDLS